MTRPGRRVVAAGLLITLGYLTITFGQVWRASLRDDTGPAEALVVLGAAQYDGQPSPVLAARLDHAADLYDAGAAPIVVVTGGNRPGDRFTEASAGANYLRGRGVPEESLRLEVRGANSWESIAAAARFLRAEGIERVILVSSPYHSYRISDIARELGLSAGVSPIRAGPSDTRDTMRALARETAAVAVGRLVGYRRLTALDRYLHTDTTAEAVGRPGAQH